MMLEYWEDIQINRIYKSREYPITEQEIIEFSRKWNPEPMHIDPEAARKTQVGTITAGGSHLYAICTKLASERRPKPAAIAGLGIEELRFLAPAKPGDRLTLQREPIAKRASGSNPAAGIVTFNNRLVNQSGDDVMFYRSVGLIKRCNALA